MLGMAWGAQLYIGKLKTIDFLKTKCAHVLFLSRGGKAVASDLGVFFIIP